LYQFCQLEARRCDPILRIACLSVSQHIQVNEDTSHRNKYVVHLNVSRKADNRHFVHRYKVCVSNATIPSSELRTNVRSFFFFFCEKLILISDIFSLVRISNF